MTKKKESSNENIAEAAIMEEIKPVFRFLRPTSLHHYDIIHGITFTESTQATIIDGIKKNLVVITCSKSSICKSAVLMKLDASDELSVKFNIESNFKITGYKTLSLKRTFKVAKDATFIYGARNHDIEALGNSGITVFTIIDEKNGKTLLSISDFEIIKEQNDSRQKTINSMNKKH